MDGDAIIDVRHKFDDLIKSVPASKLSCPGESVTGKVSVDEETDPILPVWSEVSSKAGRGNILPTFYLSMLAISGWS